MTIENIIQTNTPHFDKVIEHLHNELAGLRTGRAHPSLLATVMVESYGTKVPLEQIASVTVTDAKTIAVTPWDKSQMQAVEKAIIAANLGLNPGNDGSIIRLTLPPMTEERRKDLVKIVGQIAEQSRIKIRQAREEIMKELKQAEAAGDISKDNAASGQKKVQDLVDKYNQQVKTTIEDKEKEIMTV